MVLEHTEYNIGEREEGLEALPVPQEDFSETTEYTCHKAHNRKSLSSNTQEFFSGPMTMYIYTRGVYVLF